MVSHRGRVIWNSHRRGNLVWIFGIVWLNNIFRKSDHESGFPDVSLLDFLVSYLVQYAKCFSRIDITESKLTFGVNTNHAGLLILKVNKKSHRGSNRCILNLE